MDFHLKQWRNQRESEQQHSTKMPKFLAEPHQQLQSSAAAALPLFVPEPNSKVSTLSALSVSSTLAAPRFPRMGSYFSLAQWKELELQALIFRYMLAGAAVPPDLLQPIKKSLLHSPSPYILHPHHPLQHYPANSLQSGCYWGRAAMDPEPCRCRRTDGKKWRCSRDVVVGHKYCERHVHRGRNRSRKPVELPTSTSDTSSLTLANASLKSPFDVLRLNQRSCGTKNDDNKKRMFEDQEHVDGGDGKCDGGRTLRHFFDDWPRSSLQEPENADRNAGRINSATRLSISMPGNCSLSSSDVSLKLSTGYVEDPCPLRNGNNVGPKRQQLQLNWAGGWTSPNQVASMGGPLAEALRSSTSTSSPTSVLLRLPRNSASETSFIST